MANKNELTRGDFAVLEQDHQAIMDFDFAIGSGMLSQNPEKVLRDILPKATRAYVQSNRSRSATSTIDQVLKSKGKPISEATRYDLTNQKYNLLMENQDYQEAIFAANEMIAINPCTETYFARANAHYGLVRRITQDILDSRSGIPIDSEQSARLENQMKGHSARVINDIGLAIDTSKKPDAVYLILRGNSERILGDYKNARVDLKKASVLDGINGANGPEIERSLRCLDIEEGLIDPDEEEDLEGGFS